MVSRSALLMALGLTSFIAHAASLEKAQLLYDSQLLEDAKRELVDIAAAAPTDDEKAAALEMLGRIAIDEQRFDAAVATWTQVIEKYPNSPAAKSCADKLPLAKALAAQKAPDATPVEHLPTVSTPKLHGVIVLGAGPEPTFTTQAVNEIMNHLGSKGVLVSRGPSPPPSVPEVAANARQTGGTSVLLLTLRFGYLENLQAECYDLDGKLVWEEKAAGSFGFTKAGVAEGLITRTKAKLDPHIGSPCLPLTTS